MAREFHSGVATSVSELLYPCYFTLLYFVLMHKPILKQFTLLEWINFSKLVLFIKCL